MKSKISNNNSKINWTKILLTSLIFPLLVTFIYSLVSKLFAGGWLNLFTVKIYLPLWVILLAVILTGSLFLIYSAKFKTQNNIIKKSKITHDKLLDSLNAKPKMVKEHNVHWEVKENGTKDGPYCSLCYEDTDVKISLQPSFRHNEWFCPKCRNIYTSIAHKNPNNSGPGTVDIYGDETW